MFFTLLFTWQSLLVVPCRYGPSFLEAEETLGPLVALKTQDLRPNDLGS